MLKKRNPINHPILEIEPFGGAVTCIGGAPFRPVVRDVPTFTKLCAFSGAGDYSAGFSETRAGKFATTSHFENSGSWLFSYGNQILATTLTFVNTSTQVL